MTRLFLHVGYPKTASTTLQTHVFARHPGLLYLGRPFPDRLAAIEKDILTAEAAVFEERLPGYHAEVRQAISGAAGRTALLSHEGFLRATRYDGHDVRRTAERVHRVFASALEAGDEAGVIIVVRNQADLVLSHYVQFVKGRQAEFDAYLDAALERPEAGFLSSLFYKGIADHYAELFGRPQVHVLAFEDFLGDPAAFVARLCGVLGIDGDLGAHLLQDQHEKRKARQEDSYLVPDKKSASYRLARAARAVGLTGLAEGAAARGSSPVGLPEAQRRRVDDLYRADNTALAEAYGLPLAALGYPVEDGAR